LVIKADIRSFRDLEIWRKGIELVKSIYEISKSFPRTEVYGLASQVRRAAVSVPSNIAEGHIRAHKKEFKQFLFMTLGSLAELETQITIASELNYMDLNHYEKTIKEIDILGKQIRALILKLTPKP